MNNWQTPRFHQKYLKFTALVIGAFGPVFFLGSRLSTSEPARWTMDLLGWPLDGMQSYTDPTTRFLSALTGGFLLGWAVTIWCLQKWVYPIAPEGVRKSAVIGILAWFVLDSTGSYLSGNPSDVLFNVLVLLIAVGPLWWPAKS